MTLEQIKEFRSEFASIVYSKSAIKDHAAHLSTLYHYDRDGSHLDAIERGLKKRDELKAELKEKLKGKTYEEWKTMSVKISVLSQKLKRTAEQKARAEEALSEIKYPL